MNTAQAFLLGELNRHKEEMVFDWDEAARLIRESSATKASAGLRGDWEWTGGDILTDGKPTPQEDTYVFLMSTWAIPELELNGERIECWRPRKDTPGWDAGTYWPQSALDILNSVEGKVIKRPRALLPADVEDARHLSCRSREDDD